MTPAEVRKIIDDNMGSTAFIIGNGINRYKDNPDDLSWEGILNRLWRKYGDAHHLNRPEGISLPEFYDILEIYMHQGIELQEIFCKQFNKHWGGAKEHHRIILDTLQNWNVPLLTTNFDLTLEGVHTFQRYRTTSTGLTDIYPWTTYYGAHQLLLPTDGFGIWHINGMIEYARSIRLGLSHYMGSVERARKLIHNGDESLFRGKNQPFWQGHKTWLHIVFNKSLFIFGLDLEENETFLRWLLIERQKYFRKFHNRVHSGWYLMERSDDVKVAGKKFFLKGVGIDVLEVDSYEDIYRNIWR